MLVTLLEFLAVDCTTAVAAINMAQFELNIITNCASLGVIVSLGQFLATVSGCTASAGATRGARSVPFTISITTTIPDLSPDDALTV